jgi:ABC-type glycerol-3-phosphate transport system substrate-binding protein
MRHRHLPVVVLLAATVATAGCGPPDSAASPAGMSLPLRGQHLEVIAEWSGTEQAAFRAVLDGFSARTGAAVTYTSGGDNTSVLVNSRLAGGSPPDVALIAQPGVVASLAAKGQIVPLAGDAATATAANFSPSWQRLATIDGKLYGVFFKVANKSVIWYRTDAFEQAGVVPPKDWADFVTVSDALSDSGIAAMAVPAGDGWPVTDWFENIYLRLAGADDYTRLTRHQIPWTDPSVIRTLELLGDYLRLPGVVEPGAAHLSFTQSVADVFGTKPKAAQLYEGDFVAGAIAGLGGTRLGSGANFYSFPSINGSVPSVVSGGDEAVAFKSDAATMSLMAWLASPAAAAIWAARGGFLSANRNVPTSAYPDDVTRALAAAVVNSPVVEFDMSDQTPQAFGGQLGADEWTILTRFVADPGDPVGTAAALESAAVKDYGTDG